MRELLYKIQDEIIVVNNFAHVLRDIVNYRIENADEVDYISSVVDIILEKSGQLITDCDDLDTKFQESKLKLQRAVNQDMS